MSFIFKTPNSVVYFYRLIYIFLRFVFVYFAFLLFKNNDYNIYTTVISQSSLFTGLASLELYSYYQKKYFEYSKYKFFISNHLTTSIYISLILIPIYFYIGFSLYIIFFFVSEWLFMETIRLLNFKYDFRKAQLINLILKGVFPLLILLILNSSFNLSLNYYFLCLTLVNVIGVFCVFFKEEIKLKLVSPTFKPILFTVPVFSTQLIARYFDVELRNGVLNSGFTIEINKIINLLISGGYILEGFIYAKVFQEAKNLVISTGNILHIPKKYFNFNLIILPLCLFAIILLHFDSYFNTIPIVFAIFLLRYLSGLLNLNFFLNNNYKELIILAIIEFIILFSVSNLGYTSFLYMYFLIYSLLVLFKYFLTKRNNRN